MYKVMIIDDEVIIREGLKVVIDWHLYGFHVIGEATDGEEGLELVLKFQPDLILVDIRMPGLDGIQLIERLRQAGYEGQVIILTGFAEFEYAQKAVQLDVFSYLLKPIDELELIQALKVLKDKLDEASEQMRIMDEHTNELALRKYHELMLHGLWDEEEDPYLDDKGFYLTVLVAANTGEDESGFVAFRETVKKYTDRQMSAVFMMHGQTAIIIYKNKTFNQLDVILHDLYKKLQRRLEIKPFITVGRRVDKFRQLNLSYQDANGLLSRKFLFRNEDIIFWNAYIKEKTDHEGLIFDTQYIYGLVEIGNLEAMEVYLSKFSFQLTQSELAVNRIRGLCINGYIELKEKILINYPKLQHLFPGQYEIIDRIYESENLQEIIEFFYETFERISSKVCDGDKGNTIKRVLNYVHSNYNKNLKLEGLARLFGYNSSYMGTLFKKEVGRPFNTYLDELRIEHAKELLESGQFKVYEVAEKVGYKSVDYFYTKFRKYVGVSPKAYR